MNKLLLLFFCFGIAIFMISLRILSSSMNTVLGVRLRRMLQMLTYNPLLSVVSGMVATAAVQSSSAVAAIMVALVNAQVIGLKQAFGIILGANIGTTITAQIIRFNISWLAWPLMISGLFLILCIRKWHLIGAVLTCLGSMFIGLDLMRHSLQPLLELEFLHNLLINLGANSFYGILIGIVVTTFVQSSSAVTGLVIVMGQIHAISLTQAISITLGSNIGTVVTTLIASIGMVKQAKATAYADLVFNILGVLLVLPFLDQFVYLVSLTSVNLAAQIANGHTLFNLITAICALIAINPLVRITAKWAGISK